MSDIPIEEAAQSLDRLIGSHHIDCVCRLCVALEVLVGPDQDWKIDVYQARMRTPERVRP